MKRIQKQRIEEIETSLGADEIGLVMALADNELSPADAARARALIDTNPLAADAYHLMQSSANLARQSFSALPNPLRKKPAILEAASASYASYANDNVRRYFGKIAAAIVLLICGAFLGVTLDHNEGTLRTAAGPTAATEEQGDPAFRAALLQVLGDPRAAQSTPNSAPYIYHSAYGDGEITVVGAVKMHSQTPCLEFKHHAPQDHDAVPDVGIACATPTGNWEILELPAASAMPLQP